MTNDSQEIRFIRSTIAQLSRLSEELQFCELSHHLGVAELVALEIEKMNIDDR